VSPDAVQERIGRAVAALGAAFGDRLLSIALFGSRARGDARADSDIDLAVVITERGGDALGVAARALREHGLRDRPFISLVVWSRAELLDHPWLLIDVATDGQLLVDDGTLERELEDVRERLRRYGARRVPLDQGRWYWDLKPDWKPGDVIEI
jgi:predicted nucleotidyltransferase